MLVPMPGQPPPSQRVPGRASQARYGRSRAQHDLCLEASPSLLEASLLEGTTASGLGWTQAYRAVLAANQALCPWGGSGWEHDQRAVWV